MRLGTKRIVPIWIGEELGSEHLPNSRGNTVKVKCVIHILKASTFFKIVNIYLVLDTKTFRI